MRAEAPWWARMCLLGLALAMPMNVCAAGARWYTGHPYFTGADGQRVVFFTTDPQYFTDPGDLNARVSHAQADAMVAAAAAVWNVPTSRLTLAQGGVLAEHVSSANVYFDGTNVVFPDDVKVENYRAQPIAIVYDTDGSVIDTLLGSGASDVSLCRQNGVVESVDGLDPDGTVHHALLLLNGRCADANADQLLQMQYQLTRKFGRIIGVAWSQLNDNVFTGVPTPTLAQVLAWPLMHPMDVICGPYTYKCMAQPFSLREDDVAALAFLYPVTAANISAGKKLSLEGALTVRGFLTFPTGQGMSAVNVVVRKQQSFTVEDEADYTSAVAGAMYQQFPGNVVTGAPHGIAQSAGTVWPDGEAMFDMARVTIVGTTGWETLRYRTESINPLYSGEYAVAPYVGKPTAMSGPAYAFVDGLINAGALALWFVTPPAAAASCNTGNDGREDAPVAGDASGFWTGLLCANKHASWWSQEVKPGHSWTMEVTAVDEAGSPSLSKARPLLGVWNAADATGISPTVAFAAAAFNSQVVAMTQLRMSAPASAQKLRIAVTDERGRGRPDFAYKMRVLYADNVMPAQVGANGGRITVTGTGFKQGNRVLVNGVAAAVVSWTATTIVATAPTRTAAKMTAAGFADVAVVDASTGGTTVIQGALSYGDTAPYVVTLVSAPVAAVVGYAASPAFVVRVTSPDGVTPVGGAGVRLEATGGTLGVCGAASCSVATDAAGLVQTTLTASTAGAAMLTATEVSGGGVVRATIAVREPVRAVNVAAAALYLAAGAAASWTLALSASEEGAAAAGVAIAWSADAGLSLGAVSSATDAHGAGSAAVSTAGLSAGAQADARGCVWVTVCASSRAYGVDPKMFAVSVMGGAGQSVPAAAALSPVTLQVTDGAGHAVEGAVVTVYQTMDAWEGPCPVTGRCAAAPVLASAQKMLTTDANGQIVVAPLDVAGVAGTVHIAAAAGAQGFVALTLTKTP